MLSFDSASADPDPDWFRLKLIDDPAYPQGGKRWVLDNPLAESEPTSSSDFVVFGLYGITGDAFKDGQDPEEEIWGEYTVLNPDLTVNERASKEAWLRDLIEFFFAKNINTLGPKACFTGGESKWCDKKAKARYDFTEKTCGDTPPPDYFHYKAGPSAIFHKAVSAHIEDEHGTNPQMYPHPYFPFLSYVYITEPLHESMLKTSDGNPGRVMVPDVWHEQFSQEAYFKAFLVLSDKNLNGRWVFSEDDSLDVPYVNDSDVLVVPGFWACHRPAGLCNYDEMIAVSLGYDVPWCWIDVNPGVRSHVSFLRTWIRALLAQKYNPGSEIIPPARHEFASLMQDKYVTASAWNDEYADDGYGIEYFMLDEAPQGTSTEVILETMDLTGGYGLAGQYFNYPDDCFPGEGDENYNWFSTWLRDYENAQEQYDLGRELTRQDAAWFTIAISEKYHAIAIDAIRFFDENHMIFTECDNWLSATGDTYDPTALIKSILNTSGEVFDTEDDRYFALMTQIYPNTPERGVVLPYDETGLASYYSRCKQFQAIETSYYGDYGETFPILIGSFTHNANWEHEWGYNWEEDDTCPIIGERRIDPDWFKHAPLPHGWDDNGEFDCLDPRMYAEKSSTETGLSRRYDTGVSVENGRGDDYNTVTSALLSQMTISGDEEYVVFLGLIWHDFYNNGLERGLSKENASNWGFVNQSELLHENSDPQYYELHEFAHHRNGSFQKLITDEEWSRDGYAYPVPVIADEFGEYTED